MFRRLTLFTVILTLLLAAQTPKPTRWGYQGQNVSSLVPTSAADVCTYHQGQACSTTQTIYLTSLVLYSPTATPDTCYVIDKSSTPVPIFGTAAHPETVSGLMIQSWPDVPFNGIRWACTNGTTWGYLQYDLPQ